ncbi:HepT-like ribonuclease domain-containing protein [Ferrimicrobium sp.]|uniref:HepT-like ribonuclease domain-containing protein n=1 Tax=Ferrimicrobium sp. TaxID=2926050 RepID=UPI00261236EB|nr:HepT-like ribonuclease domain-containing protein [Ferrimicrobium sp.]
MTQHSDLLYLTHIDEAAKGIEDTVIKQGRSSLNDALIRDATMYRLQTLTESSQRLSAAFREEHADIPWRQLAGFRNQLARGY